MDTISYIIAMIACHKAIEVADYVHASLYLMCNHNNHELTQMITYEEYEKIYNDNMEMLEIESNELANEFLFKYEMINEQ